MKNFYFVFCANGAVNQRNASSAFQNFLIKSNTHNYEHHLLYPPHSTDSYDNFENKADCQRKQIEAVKEWLYEDFPKDLAVAETLVIVFEPQEEVIEYNDKLDPIEKGLLLERINKDIASGRKSDELPTLFQPKFIRNGLLNNQKIKNLIFMVGHENGGVDRNFLVAQPYAKLMLALSRNNSNLNAASALSACFALLEIADNNEKFNAYLGRTILEDTPQNRERVQQQLIRNKELLPSYTLPKIRYCVNSRASIKHQVKMIELNSSKSPYKTVNLFCIWPDPYYKRIKKRKNKYLHLYKANFLTLDLSAKIARYFNSSNIKINLQIFASDQETTEVKLSPEYTCLYFTELLNAKFHYYSTGKQIELNPAQIEEIKENKNLTQHVGYVPENQDLHFLTVLANTLHNTKGEIVMCISPNQFYRQHGAKPQSAINFSHLTKPNIIFLPRDRIASYEEYLKFIQTMLDTLRQKSNRNIFLYVMEGENGLDPIYNLFTKLQTPKLLGPLFHPESYFTMIKKQQSTQIAARQTMPTMIKHLQTKRTPQFWTDVKRNYIGEITSHRFESTTVSANTTMQPTERKPRIMTIEDDDPKPITRPRPKSFQPRARF